MDCLLGNDEGPLPNIDSDVINDQERAELQCWKLQGTVLTKSRLCPGPRCSS